jgi:hypothetical protein
MPNVPSPNALFSARSTLCPNKLDPASTPPSANDLPWNVATGVTPCRRRNEGIASADLHGTAASANLKSC